MTGWRDRSSRPGMRVRRLTTAERRQVTGMLVGVLVGLALITAGVVMTITSNGQRSFGSVLLALGAMTLATTWFAAFGKNAPARGRRAGLIVLGIVWLISVLGIIAYAVGR